MLPLWCLISWIIPQLLSSSRLDHLPIGWLSKIFRYSVESMSSSSCLIVSSTVPLYTSFHLAPLLSLRPPMLYLTPCSLCTCSSAQVICQWNIQNSPCGKRTVLHPGIPYMSIHSQGSPHHIFIHISSVYPLNSYIPPHSAASNSIFNLQSTLSPSLTEQTPGGVLVRITSPSWNRGGVNNGARPR